MKGLLSVSVVAALTQLLIISPCATFAAPIVPKLTHRKDPDVVGDLTHDASSLTGLPIASIAAGAPNLDVDLSTFFQK